MSILDPTYNYEIPEIEDSKIERRNYQRTRVAVLKV